MEFWAVEVRSGEAFDVKVGEGNILKLTQASLGESKKEREKWACLYMTVDEKKLPLTYLHPKRLPQQVLDLVLEKDFQISHNWKNGSVYFYGYKAQQPGYEHVSTVSDHCL